MLKVEVKVTRVDLTDSRKGFKVGDVLEGKIDREGAFVYRSGDFLYSDQFEIVKKHIDVKPQKDELVLVKDGDDHTWEARYFSHREKDLFYCFKYSQTSKETNEVESWKVLRRIKLVD